MVIKFNHPHCLKIGSRRPVRLPASRIITCDECSEEQYVVRPCSCKQDSYQLFFVKMDES